MTSIKSRKTDLLDLLQYAHTLNRYTSDAISALIYHSLSHLEIKPNPISGNFFVDPSLAPFIVDPHKLIHKLFILGLNPTLYNWLLNFITERPQSVRIG